MFRFDPISTSNIISIVQLVAVIGGFYFSWNSLNATHTQIGLASQSLNIAVTNLNTASDNLKLATDNAKAQLYNQMLMQGRELQLKFMDLLVPEPEKAKFFMAIIIAYYAGCFELRRVLSLPEYTARLLDNDIKESMRDNAFRERFDELRNLHSKDFGKHVDELRGVA